MISKVTDLDNLKGVRISTSSFFIKKVCIQKSIQYIFKNVITISNKSKNTIQVISKHKKVLKLVKGQYGRRKNTIRVAKQAMEKAMQYAYRDRRNKKRDFKSLWIQRINAGVRAEGMTYSKFINGLSKCGVAIDRKILAEIAYDSPEAFKTIVQKAQSALN